MKIPNKLSGDLAHAYTELAIFDRLAGPGQVYETNEDLKKGLINAYKEFLEEYKDVGGKIVQFDTVSGNFLTHQTQQVTLRKVILIWQN